MVEKGRKLPKSRFIVCVHYNTTIEEVCNCSSTASYFICQQSTMAGSFFEKKSYNSSIWCWKKTLFLRHRPLFRWNPTVCIE